MEELGCFPSELGPLKADTALSEMWAAGNASGMRARSHGAAGEEMKSRLSICAMRIKLSGAERGRGGRGAASEARLSLQGTTITGRDKVG